MKVSHAIRKCPSGILICIRWSMHSLALFVCCMAFTMLPTTIVHADTHTGTDITADNVQFNARKESLIASGRVSITHENWLISTDRLDYQDGVITMQEPIYIYDTGGNVFRAKQVEIDTNTMEKILTGVRLLLSDHHQLSSGSYIEDKEGNVIIRDAIVTSCRICSIDEKPLWHFRARSMIIPKDSDRAYLKQPEFVLADTRLGGIPWISVPASGEKRLSGFLYPEVSYSNDDGFGLMIPYFLVLGDHAGLTLSPGATTKRQFALAYDYKHRFTVGKLDLSGVVNRNDRDDDFIKEKIELDSDWKFSPLISATAIHHSELSATHARYGGVYSRLQDLTAATLTFRSDDTMVHADVVRANPDDTSVDDHLLKSHVGLDFRHHVHANSLPFNLELKGWFRESKLTAGTMIEENPMTPMDMMATAGSKHRQVTLLPVRRYGIGAILSRTTILPNGLVGKFTIQGKLDRLHWYKSDDADEMEGTGGMAEKPIKHVKVKSDLNSVVTSFDLSLPMSRQAGNATQVLEPFIQVVYSKDRDVPSTELPSADMELDQSNIRSPDRFAGDWLKETGLRVNSGVRLSGYMLNGGSYALLFGNVYRKSIDKSDVDKGGLDRSDYVLGGEYKSGSGLGLSQMIHHSKSGKIRSAQSIIGYSDGQNNASAMAAWTRHNVNKDGLWGYRLNFDRNISPRVNVGVHHSRGSEIKSESSSGLDVVYRYQCASILAGIERTKIIGGTSDLKYSLAFRLSGFQSISENGQNSCG